MNILIPMVSSTHNQSDDSYFVKSLQEINRKTILQYAFESMSSLNADKFIAVVKREDVTKFHLDSIVKLLRSDGQVIVAEGDTQGAACSCLLAVDLMDLDAPLLIAGNDQVWTVPLVDIVASFQKNDVDAGVAVFEDIHPRWSYVKIDSKGMVVEAAEKRPISHHATAGLYYFKKASDFVEAAKGMIIKRAHVRGSYYICPTLNELILKQKKIGTYPIKKEQYYNLNHESGMEAFKNYLDKGGIS